MIRKVITLLSLLFVVVCCEKEPNVDVYNFDSIENIRISNLGNYYQPNEPTIAINPSNPLNLIAGANLKYYFYSFDGGKSWDQGELYTSHGALCDPCVKFDNNGIGYYAHLARAEGEHIADRMVVQKSIDGGVSWDDGVGFEKNDKYHDREWMAIDKNSSKYLNNIYVTWTQYDELFTDNTEYNSTILCSTSQDEGINWSKATIVSDNLGDCSDTDMSLQAAKPAIGPNGELYVCWAGDNKIFFDKSIDGGNTFGIDKVVTEQIGGWELSNIPGVKRTDGCPSLVCDVSNSKYRGNIYLLWSDIRNGIENTDVFIKKSTDGGNTWSELKLVNDDNSHRHQFLPSMTIDPITGHLYVVFYDRRETIGYDTDVYVARSKDGGETFTNFRVNKGTFTTQGEFLGDYIDIAAYDNKVYPIWTTTFKGEQLIMTALLIF